MRRFEIACAVLVVLGFGCGEQPQNAPIESKSPATPVSSPTQPIDKNSETVATDKKEDAAPKKFIPVERFKDLPAGWSVVDSIVLSEDQIAGFSKRFGGEIVRTTNTRLSLNGQQICLIM